MDKQTDIYVSRVVFASEMYRIPTKFVSSKKEKRPGHLLDVVCAVGIEDVTNLKLFQRLLNLSFLPQNQS